MTSELAKKKEKEEKKLPPPFSPLGAQKTVW
jgi:hypothetical protein